MLLKSKINYILAQIVFAYIFLVAGCIISLLQLIIRPLNCFKFHRKVNAFLTYLHWSVIPAYSQWVCNLEINLWAPKGSVEKFVSENSIVVANHKYQLDWLSMWCLGDTFGVLQNFKSMAKYALLHIPVIGWQFWLNDYVIVKRKLEEDKATLEQCFKKYKKNSLDGAHFWLAVFCEGTRFTEQKHLVSMRYAVKKNLKPLKHHLLPRTRGFTMLSNGMRDFIPSVFDATICFKNESDPTILEMINGKQITADIILKHIPMKDIPINDEENSNFLMDLYYEKDDLCEFHKKNKRFPTKESEKYENYVKVPVKKSQKAFTVLFLWFLLLVVPPAYILVSSLDLATGVVFTTMLVLSITYSFNSVLSSGKAQSSYGITSST